MQYQVPQFIDVEDKIFGPLTAKQFFYLAVGTVLILIMYVFLQLWVVIILGSPMAALSLALAFLKVNGVPFIKVLASAMSYSTSKRLYLWKKSNPSTENKGAGTIINTPDIAAPKLTRNKLQDLAWSLDIQEITKR